MLEILINILQISDDLVLKERVIKLLMKEKNLWENLKSIYINLKM